VFSFFFTPLGRYVALAMLAIALTSYGIHIIREGAVAEIEVKATEDVLRRTENAINAGDAVDVSADGVRKPDAYSRDK